ncbi:MAG TPA: GMC family oxidoreductase N-terminal domain-containing protein [Novosphingobium sp.]|nr:GMC family oxidoreductase N-terminal domain-containing protein [Novosphingobium sp.]
MMDTFDYVVVGAGSAGCVMAARLSEDPAHRVLLIEAGGSDRRWDVKVPLAVSRLWPNPDLTWGFLSEPEAQLDGRRLPVARGRMLGGTSSLNGMMAIRGHAADYDGWRDGGLPGWGWQDVLPWFRRMEQHWRGAGPLHGGDGPLHVEPHPAPGPLRARAEAAARAMGYPITEDFNGERTDGFGMPDFTIHNGRRWSAADAYLRPVMGRPNLKVVTGALVMRVLMAEGRATGVTYRLGDQTRQALARTEVVLCGGAINSPQLLMLSGIGPGAALAEAGIETLVHSPQVGANLQDHPGAGLEFELRPDLAFDGRLRLDRMVGAGLRWLARGKSVWGAPPLAISANIASRPGDSQVDLHFLLVPLAMEARLWFPGVARPFGPRLSAMWSLNYPKSRGRLTLTSADPAAHPRIAFNLLDHPDDRTAMIHGYRELRRLLAQAPLAEVVGPQRRGVPAPEDDDAVLAYIRAGAATAYHPAGTCRMGGDEDAVVDGELRLRGLRGLRVVDASVFPRLPGGNTNLPVIMVAERAADFIRMSSRG